MLPKTFVVAVLALAASLLAGDASADPQPLTAAQMMDDLMFGRVPIGGPFSLVGPPGSTREVGDHQIDIAGARMVGGSGKIQDLAGPVKELDTL